MSLGIITSDKLLQMLLDLSTADSVEYLDLPGYYYALGDSSFEQAQTEDSCKKAGLKFGYWKVYQQSIMGREDCTLEEFRNIGYTQWRDCVLTVAWKLPKIYRLHFECVAVAIAYKYLQHGRRVVRFVQNLVDVENVTGEIDQKTVWAIKRYASTRELARMLAKSIIRWKPGMHHAPSPIIEEGEETPPAYNIIGQLDLTFEEKASQYNTKKTTS